VSLARFAVRQGILMHLLFGIAMLAGIFVLGGMNVDVFPNVSFAQAKITTAWTGASSEDVEQFVTREIEDEIDGVQGIDRIVSFSQKDLSIIDVKFREDLSKDDYERFYDDLRAAVERVADLPEDAEDPVLREQTVNEIYPLVQVVVVDRRPGDPPLDEARELVLRSVARELIERLEGLRDVLRVGDQTLRDRELVVELSPEALRAYGLTALSVYEEIRRQHRDAPAGPFPGERGETTMRVVGEFKGPEDLLELSVPLPGNSEGASVRLGDLARIEDSFARRSFRGRFNGRDSLALGVFKRDGADSIDVRDAVMAEVEAFRRERLPTEMSIETVIDTTKVIKNRIRVLRDSLLLGVVLVFFLLWLFVGARNSFLAVLGVPFSFLLALVFLEPMDISINALSLFSMVLVSGMIVDDAIIVIENIYRHVEQGASLREAAIEGTREVTAPVLAATLTTLAAFLPMLMMEGVVGVFLSIIPKTVAACLIASLVECFLILPAHYVDWGPRRRRERRFDGWFEKLRDRYLEGLRRTLRFPKTAVLIGVLAFAGALGLVRLIDVHLFPSDFQAFYVNLELPADYGLDDTAEATTEIEAILAKRLGEGEVEAFTSSVGTTWTTDNQLLVRPNVCQILVAFTDEVAQDGDPDRLINEIRREVRAFGASGRSRHDFLALEVDAFQDGPPIGKPVAVRVTGEDYERAGRLARQIAAALESMPGVFGVTVNLREGPEEVRIAPDRERTARLGANFEELTATVRLANEGLVAGRFRAPESDDEIEIRVRCDAALPDRIGVLEDIETPLAPRAAGAAGAALERRVRSAELLDIERGRDWLARYHYDTERCVLVTADVDSSIATSSEVNAALQERFSGASREFPGLRLDFGGEFEETQRSFASLGKALIVALLIIYTILAGQFRSYLLPFVIIAAVPLAFIGVVVGLFVLGLPFTITTFIAVVGLTGIAVNDSLVLIEFVRGGVRRGLSPLDAVVEGCRQRFRAILLTTATTVFGLLPMSFELTGKSKIWSPFAATLSSGLVVASVLTLFFVPALYLILSPWLRSDRHENGDAESHELSRTRR
jgi:multidrug efflux pump subunit AcrB